jgi:hypothetical protein
MLCLLLLHLLTILLTLPHLLLMLLLSFRKRSGLEQVSNKLLAHRGSRRRWWLHC